MTAPHPNDKTEREAWEWGATARMVGTSVSQATKPFDRYDHDRRQACVAGWKDMDTHLRLIEIVNLAKGAD